MINTTPGPDMDVEVGLKLGINVHIATGEKLSTTWNGMRLVVEEMQRRGWWLYVDQRRDNEFNVRFWNSTKGIWSEFVLAGPLPFAVCMAALKALEDSQNE